MSGAPLSAGSGANSVGIPSCSSFAPGVVSGSPARSCRATLLWEPSKRFWASPAASQCPSLVIPIGTTSNFFRSIAFKTDAADSSETSCSPLRPPKRIHTRSFFAISFWIPAFMMQTKLYISVEPLTGPSSQTRSTPGFNSFAWILFRNSDKGRIDSNWERGSVLLPEPKALLDQIHVSVR